MLYRFDIQNIYFGYQKIIWPGESATFTTKEDDEFNSKKLFKVSIGNPCQFSPPYPQTPYFEIEIRNGEHMDVYISKTIDCSDLMNSISLHLTYRIGGFELNDKCSERDDCAKIRYWCEIKELSL